MYELKTRETDSSVLAVIDQIASPDKREDALALIDMFTRASDFPPRVWGTKQIGFGRYRYKYPSGHQGEFYMTGFSVGKTAISLYLHIDEETGPDQLRQLGKVTAEKSCVYIKKLDGIDLETLKEMIAQTVRFVAAAYPEKAAGSIERSDEGKK